MSPNVVIILACWGIGLIVAHILWVKARVWMLRQDLFEIRDRLWFEMADAGLKDDPAHRQIRQSINAMIRLAPAMSLIFFASMLFHGLHKDAIDWSAAPMPVRRAATRMTNRMKRYLLFQTLTGWIILGLAAIFFMQTSMTDWIGRCLGRLMRSEEITRGRAADCIPAA